MFKNTYKTEIAKEFIAGMLAMTEEQRLDCDNQNGEDGIPYTVIVKFDEDPECNTIEIEHGHNRGTWFNLELDGDSISQVEEMIDIAIEFEEEKQAAA